MHGRAKHGKLAPMLKTSLFLAAILVIFIAPLNAAHALLVGVVFAFFKLVPEWAQPAKWSKKTLALAIVGLGFGIQISAALAVGRENAVLIMSAVMLTLFGAWWLTRWLGLVQKTGFLIGSGTAICGGSAIAAVAPAIRANSEQIAIALGCVFILNACALILFPLVGHWLQLDPHTFAVWAAVAIHDTSSVVGAAQAYHPDSIGPATTLKLARALLIVPVVLLSVWLFAERAPTARQTLGSLPNFILWFIAAIVLAQMLPGLWPPAEALFAYLVQAAQQLLILSLFFVGASLNLSLIRRAGLRPVILASVLWLLIASGTLLYLLTS